MSKVLFVEDEDVLGRLVKEAMERKNMEVHWARNGMDGLQLFRDVQPDICVLDVMLPAMDGFTLARHIRNSAPTVPILFLTARSQTADVVKGFESGGNDYLKKPFGLEELFVRIRELLKRGQTTAAEGSAEGVKDVYELGAYHFYPARQLLKCGQASYNLSNREAELLKELILHKNDLMERRPVLIKLWGDDNFFNARNMDVYIGKLRKYLVHDPRLSIVNIRGYGFKLIEQLV